MHDPAAPDEVLDERLALRRQLAESREACESARAECRRLRLIMDNAPVLLAYLDTEHRYRFVNAAYALRFGSPAGDVIGRSVADVLGEKVWAEIEPFRERVIEGEALNYEVDVELRPSQPQCMHCVLNPARDAEGEVTGYVVAISDVTEARKNEAAIKASEEALRDADRRKDEFLALLAHELRNPLAPLVNAVELLRSVGNPALHRVRDMMDRQLRHLQRLVDDLLDVSRISRGRFELRREPVDVRVAIETAVEACNSLVTTRRHALTVSVPSESLLVEGDFARLTQVFANLVSNSAKYTEPGGHIEVSLCKSEDGAVVTVRDTGLGIPSESLDIVFDMFSQVQAHKLYAGGGLGIGLALVRSLVEMHGGRVEAQSEGAGRGSTFTVWLPLVYQSAAVATSDVNPPDDGFLAKQKCRILIADDNVDAAASLSLLLQMRGHETRTASNGLQAVELAAAFQPEIIFMDLGMPLLDGLEACRRIRAQPEGQSMVIVALTGWGQDRDRRQTRDAGMDLHLVKPIDLDGIATVEAFAASAAASH